MKKGLAIRFAPALLSPTNVESGFGFHSDLKKTVERKTT